MVQADLWWPTWQTLPWKRQALWIHQISRYFLSPLLAVDDTVRVNVAYFGQTFTTYDLLCGGEWLRFIPGARHVLLGAPTPLPTAWQALLGAATLSPQTAVDVSPMLVARKAVPSLEQVIGRIDLTTQRFSGDHFTYVPVKPAVLAALQQAGEQNWPATVSGQGVSLHRQSDHHYQVAIRQDWQRAGLIHGLHRYGFDLLTEHQYEYVMSGGLAQATPWGNTLPAPLPRYVPNRFGLTVPVARAGSELIAEEWGKSTALQPPLAAAQVAALSPWFRTPAPAFATSTYRKVAVIRLD